MGHIKKKVLGMTTMDEVVKVINSKFEDKLKEMNMQGEQESRFNQ